MLLKVLEGTAASVPPRGGRKHPHQDFLQIDTTRVLLIVGGTFTGLDGITNSRIGKRPLGFSANTLARKKVADPFPEVRPEDLRKFGLIPGFIGRLPMVSTVPPPDRGALNRVLIEPHNALTRQFARLFELNGVQLDFTDEATDAIAELALECGTGARGLRAILEKLLLDVMFEVSSVEDVAQVAVTREAVLGEV